MNISASLIDKDFNHLSWHLISNLTFVTYFSLKEKKKSLESFVSHAQHEELEYIVQCISPKKKGGGLISIHNNILIGLS